MDSDFVGRIVNLNCGDMGYFQGKISGVDMEDQTITIQNPFKNGKSCSLPCVTVRATDIVDLSFLDMDEPRAPIEKTASSVVQVPKKKPSDPNLAQQQKPKQTRAASFSPALMNMMRSNQGVTGKQKNKSKALPAVAERLKGNGTGASLTAAAAVAAQSRLSPRKGLQGRNTPGNSRKERERLRDEDCFGGTIDDEEMSKEFDFEGNLALFDKKLVFDEINETSNQPDLVRLVDCNTRRKDPDLNSQSNSNNEPKYRNDENVLVGIPAQIRPIETGEEPPPGEYVTDSGLVVPALSFELRERLEKVAKSKGLLGERMLDLMARAGVEMAVQLFGGAHRLNPDNSHQVPLAVVLCGPSRSGVIGMATARHLATQGVRTVAYLPDLPSYPSDLEREFKLYKMTGEKWTSNMKGLPKTPVDLIICCLEDHEMWEQERCQPWFMTAVNWAKKLTYNPPVLSIDPPTNPMEPALPHKISLVPGLPLWHSPDASSAAKIYMVNLAIPRKVYSEVGIKYDSPFGAKTIVALHRVT